MGVGSILWTLIGFGAGAAAGFFYTQFAMRPKLTLSGGGSGGEPPIATVSVRNELGFQGFLLGRTIIFGRPIWGSRRCGLNYERHPVDVVANIARTDRPRTGGQGLSLRLDGADEVKSTVRIPSGQSASIFTLVGHPERGGRFFVFVSDNGTAEPHIPSDSATFTGPAEFEISVIPTHGGRTLRLRTALVQDMQGNWHFTASGKKGGGSSMFLSSP